MFDFFKAVRETAASRTGAAAARRIRPELIHLKFEIDRTKCAIAFCEEVKAQGYKPGVYASTLWYRKRVNLNSLKKYTIWNAHYGVASSPIDCALWQGTCTARLPGYKGDMDVNISYIG